MATAPWLVLLITVIGTPLFGALLYLLVPLLRMAKRLGVWLSNPPWWVQNIFAALLVGGIVAVVSILWQERISEKQANQARRIEDLRAEQATRLENLRFVRQLSTQTGIPRPFSEFDLQGEDLSELDLTGAHLAYANLQHANLFASNLASTPTQTTELIAANLNRADLYGARLDGADLTGATLDGADLTGAYLTGGGLTGANLGGVHYDEKTKWPVGFKPPPPAPTP